MRWISRPSLLVTFNNAIDGVIQNNPKARANPKARFGMERVAKVESLREIIAEMTNSAATRRWR